MSEPTVDPRAVTPRYGWHVPVLGDVPNVPADLTALATGIEETLFAGSVRAYVATTRSGDAGAGANVSTPLVPQLSITAAPAGIYLTCVFGVFDKPNLVGSPIVLNCMKGGVELYNVAKESPADGYLERADASVMLIHTGGNLQIDWGINGMASGIIAKAGSQGFLARISV